MPQMNTLLSRYPVRSFVLSLYADKTFKTLSLWRDEIGLINTSTSQSLLFLLLSFSSVAQRLSGFLPADTGEGF